MRATNYFIGKLPNRRELFLLFGACVFVTHLYTFVVLFFLTPSLIMRMTTGKVVGAIAYVFSSALLESIVVFTVLLLLCLLLPNNFFRVRFVSQGAILVLIFAEWSVVLKPQGYFITEWYFLPFIPILIFAILMTIYSRKLRDALEAILDKISVLSTVYVLVDLSCVFVVIFRNLS